MTKPISLHGWTVETETEVDDVGLRFHHAWVEIPLKEGGPLALFNAGSCVSSRAALFKLADAIETAVTVMIHLNDTDDKTYRKVGELSREIRKHSYRLLSASA